MKKLLYLFLLFLLIGAIGCSDNEKEGSSQSTLSEEYYTTINQINVLNDDAVSYIVEDVTNDSTLVLSSTTPDEMLPTIGSKIYIPVSDKTPYGMLVRVVSIEKGTSITIGTEALSLDEVFDYLSVDTTITVISDFEGVFDADGNAVDFEIVDTAEVYSSNFPKGTTIAFPTNRTSEVMSWDWSTSCIKIAQKVEYGNLELDGGIYLGFKKFDWDIDIANSETKYFNLDITPYAKFALSSKIAGEVSFSKRLYTARFKITIPTAIPIIVPISVYIDGVGEAALSASVEADFPNLVYDCNFKAGYKNGGWSGNFTSGGIQWNEISVGKFELSGEAYIGAKLGILAGLYSSTVGVGVNFVPKAFIDADMSMSSSSDLLLVNPEVTYGLKISSELYAVAKLFGKNLAKLTPVQTPEGIIYSHNMKLLPEIEDFTATGNGTSAEISWTQNADYFLSFAESVYTGASVFDSDKETILQSYTPSPIKTDNLGNSTYSVDVTGLNAAKTYYAAPFVGWGEYVWYGNLEEFSTEASYHIGFRCASQSYDVISFDISISNQNSTSYDMTFDATDYNGTAMSVSFEAEYDADTSIFSGTFDFYFYDDPDQRRTDGFSVSLSEGDTGYVTCEKVVSNGACTAAMRVYSNSSSSASIKRPVYDYPELDEDCSVGFHASPLR